MIKEINDTSVQVAVRIRPLNDDELEVDNIHYINADPTNNQIIAGSETTFTFDHVFGPNSSQQHIYDHCVMDLVNSAFEGFNATVLAYGQTGSGKTFTMGSSSDMLTTDDMMGIIPRVTNTLFDIVQTREADDPNSSYKILVQFIEIYGEDIRDLLDHTKTSKVSIRESVNGDVFVSGAKEEFVGSVVQMAKALEDGSRHRITASTKMNSTSSRSHAIFTVIIEHTIIIDDRGSGIAVDDNATSGSTGVDEAVTAINVSQPRAEIRKSKFHFVDLAGSERAKRTGAQGVQLREGIDINKGLLALGNVISALGDDTKRGKVHVPYRDSKLTRILQDSLGGNSKTLFICCVSPAGINFTESLNALKYANRARNIKNKPVVNRDPTLVMIDELKGVIQVIGAELIQRRKTQLSLDPSGAAAVAAALGDMYISDETLEGLVSKTSSSHLAISPRRLKLSDTNPNPNSSSGSRPNSIPKPGTASGSSSSFGHNSPFTRERGNNSSSSNNSNNNTEAHLLRIKLNESDREIVRLMNEVKAAHQQRSDEGERILLIESERDYYKMKWAAACPADYSELVNSTTDGSNESPADAQTNTSAAAKEKQEIMSVVANYLREIDTLKREVAELRVQKLAASTLDAEFLSEEALLENELTSSVAKVIAQTQQHLKLETLKLRAAAEDMDGALGGGAGSAPNSARGDASDDGLTQQPASFEERERAAEDDSRLIEVEEAAFQLRQKQLSSELQHIGESIQLKEQLVQQLQKSQYQYTVMKAFYEQKLTALEQEMQQKQSERQQIENELHDLLKKANNSTSVNSASAMFNNSRELKLRDELKRRDDELKVLKKKQEDLNSLSLVQTRYLKQVSKLEAEIDNMKKTRVDLTKTLQLEKKKHLQQLNSKAKEVERLKRELSKATGEVKGLRREKERAEERTREAIREGAMFRKRATDMLRNGIPSSAADISGISLSSNSTNALTSLTSARNARRAMNSAGVPSNTRAQIGRILSEDQIHTKKWLDEYINDIHQRERAAEALRRQCELQLSLVGQKEALESKLNQALMQQQSKSPGSPQSTRKWSIDEDSLIDLNAGSSEDSGDTFHRLLNQTTASFGLGRLSDSSDINEVSPGSGDGKRNNNRVTIDDLKERVHSMNEQLKLRNKKIFEMQQQLSVLDEKLGDEKAFEQLKKTATSSLTASQDLIKVMFEMLLSCRRAISTRQDAIVAAETKEKRLRQELVDATNQIYQLERAHDAAITQVMNEYEVKLNGLFAHSAVGQVLLQESGMNTPHTPHSNSSSSGVNTSESMDSVSRENSSSGTIQSYKMLLAVSTEQCNNLKFQLHRDEQIIADLRRKVEDAEQLADSVSRELDNRNSTIAFLEEERHLFRNLSEDYKAIILAMGGSIGESIVKQVKEKTIEKAPQGVSSHGGNPFSNNSSSNTTAAGGGGGGGGGKESLYRASIFLQDDDSDDDDSASVLDAYSMIAEEINRTGRVQQENAPHQSNTSGSSYSKGVVYDRLANPTHFTGSMKHLFEQDLLRSKRQKVHKIKKADGIPPTSARGSKRSDSIELASETSWLLVPPAGGGITTTTAGAAADTKRPSPVPGSNMPGIKSSHSGSGSAKLPLGTREVYLDAQDNSNINNPDHHLSIDVEDFNPATASAGLNTGSSTHSTPGSGNKDVFSRLSKHYTGIHKYMHNSEYPTPPGTSSSGIVHGVAASNVAGSIGGAHPPAPGDGSRDPQDFRGVIEGIGYRNIDLSMLETSELPPKPETAEANAASVPRSGSASRSNNNNSRNNSNEEVEPKTFRGTGNVVVNSASRGGGGAGGAPLAAPAAGKGQGQKSGGTSTTATTTTTPTPISVSASISSTGPGGKARGQISVDLSGSVQSSPQQLDGSPQSPNAKFSFGK